MTRKTLSKQFNVGAFVKAKRNILKEIAVQKASLDASVKCKQQKIRQLKAKVHNCIISNLISIMLLFNKVIKDTLVKYLLL